MVEIASSLLGGQEAFVGETMAEQFAERGIKVLVATKIESVARPGVEDTGVGRIHGGPATVTAGGSTFDVDEIVVAAGRTPATTDLGLERIGVDKVWVLEGGLRAWREHGLPVSRSVEAPEIVAARHGVQLPGLSSIAIAPVPDGPAAG